MGRSPTACVIGAGSSGIAAAKVLSHAGIAVEVLEKGGCVGGNWVFENGNGMSSSYKTLHINTSRERMEYSDFPMSKAYPDFPHHTHIARYFNDYVDHFGIRDLIRFNNAVERVESLSGGGWTVSSSTGESHYNHVLVANGHHWDPRWPEPPFPGTDSFEGEQLHAHFYRDPKSFAGRRVLVLGMGNSAMDIAVDASYYAEHTFLAARRGAHVIPKYVFGRPLDQLSTSARIPFAVRQRMIETVLRSQVGRMENYGLPTPDHRFGEAHPTVSGRILDRLAHGAIEVKPNIAALEGRSVRFTDGSVEEPDLIVYCTGYKISFPFFDESLITAHDNEIPLFKRIFPPDLPGLAFIGLVQPLGAIMPIAERQAELVAELIRHRYTLPSPAQMRTSVTRDRRRMARRYVGSKRHTIQVDFEDYMLALDRERRRGKRRTPAAVA